MIDLPLVLFVLFAIAIFLMLVTLVGHGIWALLAAIFGGSRKKASQTRPFCGRSSPAGRDRCDWCGRGLASLMARELSDLEAVRRQLQRFREKGTMKPEVVNRLLGRLQDYRQRLLHPAAVKQGAGSGEQGAASGEQGAATAAAAPVASPTVQDPARAPSTSGRPDLLHAFAAAAPAPLPDAQSQAGKPNVHHAPAATAPVVPPVAMVQAVQSQARATSTPGWPDVLHAPAARPRAPAAAKPQPPARSWTEMLAAFMEQRNIRWGELIGGSAAGLLVDRAGGQPAGNPGTDPQFQVLHLRLDFVGRFRRRALRPSSLEAGIDQPGLAGDRARSWCP